LNDSRRPHRTLRANPEPRAHRSRTWSTQFPAPMGNWLFPELSSLKMRVGNCFKSGCTTGICGSGIVSASAKNWSFPVKFPICREFGRRQVRSALCPQPATSSAKDSENLMGKDPVICGVLARSRPVSQAPEASNFGENLPKVSSPNRRNSRSEETFSRDKLRSH
jgi:hypothetical protein